MKARIWLVMLAVCGAVCLSGCQRSGSRGERSAALSEADAGASQFEQVENRVVHSRDPKTRKMVLSEESVTTITQRPVEKAAEQLPSEPASEKDEYRINWKEKCTVRQAFKASQQVLEDLQLRVSGTSKRTIRTRDPKTGRTITKSVPTTGGTSDNLSASLSATSSVGVKYHVDIVMLPPDLCRIAITAGSVSQPKDILEEHSLFLKQKIREAICQQPTEAGEVTDADVIRDSVILDQKLETVHDVICRWARKWGFDYKTSDGDRYSYKMMQIHTGSGIQISFHLRMLGSEKTKVEITVDNVDGKDEYAVIRRSLDDTLRGDDDPALASYVDTKSLERTVRQVMDVLRAWSKANWLDWDDDRSPDAFYARAYCNSSSGIRFTFTVRLVEADRAKLEINADNFEGKDEFAVILKSLEEALAGLDEPADAAEEGSGSDD